MNMNFKELFDKNGITNKLKAIGKANQTKMEDKTYQPHVSPLTPQIVIFLMSEYPDALVTFCKERQITTEEARRRVESEVDFDFMEKILPALLHDIPVDEISKRVYDKLLDKAGISNEHLEEARVILEHAGEKRLQKMF